MHKWVFDWSKEIGIITGYIVLLTGVLVFDWSPFPIFLSFVIEYFVLLIIHTYVAVHVYKGLGPNHEVYNTLSAGIMLGLMQGIFVLVVATTFRQPSEFEYNFVNLGWNILAITFSILTFHIISLRGVKYNSALLQLRRSALFVSAIALTGTALVGGGLITLLGDHHRNVSIIVVVAARIFLEIWMHRYQQPKRKL